MRFIKQTFIELGLLVASLRGASASSLMVAGGLTAEAEACTLTASGSDDAPAFLKAAADSSCSTVTIPAGTTLSIETKMNMTSLLNKHIVSSFSQLVAISVC